MKRYVMTIALAAMLSTTSLFANSIDGKIGTSTVQGRIDNKTKFGFDAAIDYNLELDPFFSIAPQFGFQWASFDEKTGQSVTISGKTVDQEIAQDWYTFPLMIQAKIFPMAGMTGGLGGKPPVSPYLAIGGGWTWMFYESTTPKTDTSAEVTSREAFSGFAYQALIGSKFALGSGGLGPQSAVDLVLEAGYRGGKLEGEVNNNTVSIESDGWIIRAGVSYTL